VIGGDAKFLIGIYYIREISTLDKISYRFENDLIESRQF